MCWDRKGEEAANRGAKRKPGDFGVTHPFAPSAPSFCSQLQVLAPVQFPTIQSSFQVGSAGLADFSFFRCQVSKAFWRLDASQPHINLGS